MEAHEAASLYSEKKAQMLRQIGELVENKDQSLAEFMSSMQLDLLTKVSRDVFNWLWPSNNTQANNTRC